MHYTTLYMDRSREKIHLIALAFASRVNMKQKKNNGMPHVACTWCRDYLAAAELLVCTCPCRVASCHEHTIVWSELQDEAQDYTITSISSPTTYYNTKPHCSFVAALFACYLSLYFLHLFICEQFYYSLSERWYIQGSENKYMFPVSDPSINE